MFYVQIKSIDFSTFVPNSIAIYQMYFSEDVFVALNQPDSCVIGGVAIHLENRMVKSDETLRSFTILKTSRLSRTLTIFKAESLALKPNKVNYLIDESQYR